MPKLNGLPWITVHVDNDDILRDLHHAFDEANLSFDFNSAHGELMLCPGDSFVQFVSPTFTEQGWG